MNMNDLESINTSYCNKCLHFDEDSNTCQAFPNGIPSELLSGKVKHTSRFPEQVGLAVFINEREYWENEGLEFHPMAGVDDFELLD